MSLSTLTVAALAPSDAELTDYDREHAITYLRLLDAAADNADWREIARSVLGCEPDDDPDTVRRTYDTHLARARWMTTGGYKDLLHSHMSR